MLPRTHWSGTLRLEALPRLLQKQDLPRFLPVAWSSSTDIQDFTCSFSTSDYKRNSSKTSMYVRMMTVYWFAVEERPFQYSKCSSLHSRHLFPSIKIIGKSKQSLEVACNHLCYTWQRLANLVCHRSPFSGTNLEPGKVDTLLSIIRVEPGRISTLSLSIIILSPTNHP